MHYFALIVMLIMADMLYWNIQTKMIDFYENIGLIAISNNYDKESVFTWIIAIEVIIIIGFIIISKFGKSKAISKNSNIPSNKTSNAFKKLSNTFTVMLITLVISPLLLFNLSEKINIESSDGDRAMIVMPDGSITHPDKYAKYYSWINSTDDSACQNIMAIFDQIDWSPITSEMVKAALNPVQYLKENLGSKKVNKVLDTALELYKVNKED